MDGQPVNWKSSLVLHESKCCIFDARAIKVSQKNHFYCFHNVQEVEAMSMKLLQYREIAFWAKNRKHLKNLSPPRQTPTPTSVTEQHPGYPLRYSGGFLFRFIKINHWQSSPPIINHHASLPMALSFSDFCGSPGPVGHRFLVIGSIHPCRIRFSRLLCRLPRVARTQKHTSGNKWSIALPFPVHSPDLLFIREIFFRRAELIATHPSHHPTGTKPQRLNELYG